MKTHRKTDTTETGSLLRVHETRHPLLYEVNTRVLINELSASTRKKITLATIPDSVLDEWASIGFDAVWLMGVWSTGKTGQKIAREFPGVQEEYRNALPDVKTDDIVGSPYAVKGYTVSPALGGNKALLALRKRLEKRGIAVILDFVSNHTARDHPWVAKYPEFYIHGQPGEEISRPEYYFKASTSKGDRTIAFGRDPTYPGWTDTAQLNHLHPALRGKLLETMSNIGKLCDGVRCDMAMLMLRSVFERTWGDLAGAPSGEGAEGEFWKDLIEDVRKEYPHFLFIAEAYWDLEWQLQQVGFDFTYDKRLLDKLLREGASSVYDHLRAELTFQNKLVRFLENHDEPRIAQSLPSVAWHCAAVTVAATVPGMILIHEGQLEGRRKRVPVQLRVRAAEEPVAEIRKFYCKLLECLRSPVFREGSWSLLGARPAWQENSTWRNFLAFWWDGAGHGRRLVVINYAPHNSQCFFQLPFPEGETGTIEFRDLLGSAVYYREKGVLTTKGMFFDLPPYATHLFMVSPTR